MQISEENKALIEEAVQTNEFYIGNEHLFEKFYNEISRRTYLVISTKSNEEVQSYLKNIASKIMNDVIEREKTSIEYKKMLKNASSNGIVSLKKIAEQENRQFDNVIDFRKACEKSLSRVEDPISHSTNKNNMPTIQNILEALYVIHQKDPLKYYFQIFYLKYYSQMKQADIARNLNLTQSELSIRFSKMLDELKDMGLHF